MKPLEPLDGEVYAPSEVSRFFLFEHALRSTRHICDVPAGLSITEALDLSLEDSGWRNKYRHNFTIFLQDGTAVPEHMWDRVRLKAGTTAVARPVAEGPLFALIPLLGTFSTFITSLGFFGQLLMAGITMGLKFLLSKLFAPKQPKPDVSDRKAVYSIVGSRNEISQWQPIPLVLGRHRMTPPLAASPYTETVGDEQYLRQLFCNGYGPLDIEENTAKIGETLVSTYSEAEVQHREGYTTDTDTTLYPKSVIDRPFAKDLKLPDPPLVEATATDTVSVALDFMWPQGLCNIDEEGKRLERGVNIIMNWRKAAGEGNVPPAGAWSGNLSLNFKARTQKTIRKTYVINLPAAGSYEVRVHKASEEPDVDKWAEFNWTGLDEVQWTAIRSFRTGEPVTFSDAPLSFTAIRVRASGRLNQVVDTYNVVVQSRVTAFNGTTWVANTPSRRPPDLFRHVLTCKANRRPYAITQIDLPALQKWWTYCVQQDWRYDKILLSQMSVYDLITEICAAGRAMPVFKDGKWSVVWDEQDVPISQLFTPRNSWNFEEQRDLEPIPHAYRIRFPDELTGWRENERVVYNDGYDKTNATLLEGFEIPGVTHTNRVWKHGRFHLAQRILRPGIYTLMTSWDALPLIRGDRIRVNFDSFEYGLYAGRVTGVDAATQTFSADVGMLLAGATNYMVRFRLTNGTFLERTIDPGYVGEFTTIGLVGTAMPMPAVGDLFSLGTATKDSRIFRVTGIEPEDNLVHRLTMVADAPEIADADVGQIPDYAEGITAPIDPFLMPPTNLRVTDGAYADGGGQYWANLLLTWQPPAYGRVAQFQIQYREESDEDDVWTSGGSLGPNVTTSEIRRLESGVYRVRVRCVFDNGKFSNWVYAPAHATTELVTPPPNVTGFRVSVMGDISIFRWDEVEGAGVTYELRWASELVAIPSWNAAIALVNSAVNSVQTGTRTGTFFIKAKKPWGLTSKNAASISSLTASFNALNFVAQITENPGWTGVKDGVLKQDTDELRLIPNATNTDYNVVGTYYFANRIDFGEKISSRMTIIMDAYGFNPLQAMSNWLALSRVNPLDTTDQSQWTVNPEFRISMIGSPFAWGPWQPFSLSDILAWAIEFRLVLRGKADIDAETDDIRSATTPSVKVLTVRVDMQDRIEKGNDVVCPATAAGVTVTYPSGRYRVKPAVVITAQGLSPGDYWTVDTITTTSFRVRFGNQDPVTNAITIVSRTFDWMAKGWGRTQ